MSANNQSQPPPPNQGQGDAGGVFGANNLYQSVIIALVAGGVFSLGFASIVWRRRRFREMQAELRDRRIRLEQNPFMTLPRTGGFGTVEERDVGRQPSFWDVIIGEKRLAGADGVVMLPKLAKNAPGRDIGVEEVVDVDMKEKEKGSIDEDEDEEEEEREVDVDGQMSTGWIPTSLALSQHKLLSADAGGRIAAEVTVLISMPSESSSSTPSSPRARSVPIYESSPDEDTLPPVQIASTTVNVASLNLARRRELERWMRDAEKRRNSSGNTSPRTNAPRFERTDGFRGDG